MYTNKILIAGAAPDTGNLGVSALCDSVISGLMNFFGTQDFSIVDFKKGFREAEYQINGVGKINLVGGKRTRNPFIESSFSNIAFQSKMGLFWTKTARQFRDGITLDVSGGDSFTDMYGDNRFRLVTWPKEIAMINNRPLILLPHTLGPFEKNESFEKAKEYLEYSSLVYVRDKYSFDYLKKILGEKFDPAKHKLGVDMAFLLEPDFKKYGAISDKMAGKENYGINVSGLIYNNPADANKKYDIVIDYKKILQDFIGKVLLESDGNVWLVPHVIVPAGHHESDLDACLDLKGSLSDVEQKRVFVFDDDYDQREVKGVVANMDWFAGCRMHATIASLSSAVPTVNMAYSGKALGVFATVGCEDSVFDLRTLSEQVIIDKLLSHWRARNEIRAELAPQIDAVKNQAREQLSEIASVING